MTPNEERRWLERHLESQVARSSKRYGLLVAGDHVMVGVSGGKDSYTLLHLLHHIKRRLPFPLQITAVHLDQGIPGYDGQALIAYLRDQGYPFEILKEDTYAVFSEKMAEKATFCSMCSRLRRGILYTAAKRLGCNKIALGHHREDTLHTLMLNLMYAGKLQAMPAIYQTDDGEFKVIRPMIEISEEHIRRFTALQGFPLIPSGDCGSAPSSKRAEVARWLETLEASHPNLKAVMLNALKNVRPSHLLDPDLLPKPAAAPKERKPPHHAALPIASQEF